MRVRTKVTHDGGLDVEVSLERLDLVAFGGMLSKLLREVTAAERAQQAADRIEAEEALEAEKRAELFKVRARLALSIYRRTDSPRLAGRCAGIQSIDMRFIITEANKRQRACHREARRQLVGRLHAQGISVTEIARRARVHVKSVPRIAREIRQGRLALEHAEVLPPR